MAHDTEYKKTAWELRQEKIKKLKRRKGGYVHGKTTGGKEVQRVLRAMEKLYPQVSRYGRRHFFFGMYNLSGLATEMNIAGDYLSTVLYGKGKPSVEFARKLAEALYIEADDDTSTLVTVSDVLSFLLYVKKITAATVDVRIPVKSRRKETLDKYGDMDGNTDPSAAY